MLDSSLAIPYLLSNLLGLVMLVIAWRWATVARVLIVAGFVTAGVFNIVTALADPEGYLRFADHAWPPYPWLVEHVFALAPRGFVLAIATAQIAGAVLLAFGARRVARAGALVLVVFLVAIAPFGIGSAFPSSLLLAAAVWCVRERLRP